jgi:hypothetical protein
MSWVSCFSLGRNKNFLGKPLGNRPLQRSRHWLADDIKLELTGIGDQLLGNELC